MKKGKKIFGLWPLAFGLWEIQEQKITALVQWFN